MFPSRIIAPLSLCLSAVAAFADDYAQWAHSLDLYTNTSPDGAYVTSTVRHFPLLVRLTAANFDFSQAQGKGRDIRFAAPDGSHLAYQIDRWDSASAAAEVWVKLDSLRGDSWTQALRMLWGKPDAADSSNGAAVFDSADGNVAVWHLGQADTLPRPNAVPGGNPAAPVNYNGDESRLGVIGLADSLDGSDDYLDLGQGYSQFNQGFTYSVWAKASSAAFWSRLLDMGNGAPMDNLVLQRHLTAYDIDFDQYHGALGDTRVDARNAFPVDEWAFYAITVSGKTASLYWNGVLVNTGELKDTIHAVTRLNDYIGKSNWAGNDYFRGKIDEARLARTARGADWIKLCYANQNPSQNLLYFHAPDSSCLAHFAAPKDTSVNEGGVLELRGRADCAAGYSWSVVSGPAPRILDPEVKDLRVEAPRVKGDAVIKYRFSARYGDVTSSQDVAVTVKEAIPDPNFTLPAGLTWSGRDSLLYKAKLNNLAAIKATPDSILAWAWSLSGVGADTAWRDGALLLKSPQQDGTIMIKLCLDNGGSAVCHSAPVTVNSAAAALLTQARPAAAGIAKAFDSRGRRVDLRRASGHGSAPDREATPRFLRPEDRVPIGP